MSGPHGLLVISHLKLRLLVGILGVLLPVILAALGFVQCGCLEIQPSISHYYDLDLKARDVFVGVLFAIATFLWAYRGYEYQDMAAAKLASIFALGVAIFPHSGSAWERVAHFGSAGLLFAVLSYFALVLFTKTGGDPTPEKKLRNLVYRACGATILASMALMSLMMLFGWEAALAGLKPTFWLESVALWAFGISWFVKGEALLADAPGQPSIQATTDSAAAGRL